MFVVYAIYDFNKKNGAFGVILLYWPEMLEYMIPYIEQSVWMVPGTLDE